MCESAQQTGRKCVQRLLEQSQTGRQLNVELVCDDGAVGTAAPKAVAVVGNYTADTVLLDNTLQTPVFKQNADTEKRQLQKNGKRQRPEIAHPPAFQPDMRKVWKFLFQECRSSTVGSNDDLLSFCQTIVNYWHTACCVT